MTHRFITRIRSIKPWYSPYFSNRLIMYGVYDLEYMCYLSRLVSFDRDVVNSYTWKCNSLHDEIFDYNYELSNYLGIDLTNG